MSSVHVYECFFLTIFLGTKGKNYCILALFEWDQEDLDSLYAAKAVEISANDVRNPSTAAVRNAVGKKEVAGHCRSTTGSAEVNKSLLESLFSTMATATDVPGVPFFRDEIVTEVWPEQRRHIPCIQDPPEIPGKALPIYRCSRGTNSPESFHLSLARNVVDKARIVADTLYPNRSTDCRGGVLPRTYIKMIDRPVNVVVCLCRENMALSKESTKGSIISLTLHAF